MHKKFSCVIIYSTNKTFIAATGDDKNSMEKYRILQDKICKSDFDLFLQNVKNLK